MTNPIESRTKDLRRGQKTPLPLSPGDWQLGGEEDIDGLGFTLRAIRDENEVNIAFGHNEGDVTLMAHSKELLEAAEALLKKLGDMTTADFAKSAERREREALSGAVRRARGQV